MIHIAWYKYFPALPKALEVQKALISPITNLFAYTSDDVLLLMHTQDSTVLWLISSILLALITHIINVPILLHCIQGKRGEIDKNGWPTVVCNIVCACVCGYATSFSGPIRFFILIFQPYESFLLLLCDILTVWTKWKIEGKSAYRAWLNTICFACLLSLSSFSPNLFWLVVWLVGWLDVFACWFQHQDDDDDNDKRR